MRAILNRRAAVMAFSFLFLRPRVGSAAMPVTDPDPHKILTTLRTVETELRALVAARPGDALARAALGAVEVSIVAMSAIVSSMTA